MGQPKIRAQHVVLNRYINNDLWHSGGRDGNVPGNNNKNNTLPIKSLEGFCDFLFSSLFASTCRAYIRESVPGSTRKWDGKFIRASLWNEWLLLVCCLICLWKNRDPLNRVRLRTKPEAGTTKQRWMHSGYLYVIWPNLKTYNLKSHESSHATAVINSISQPRLSTSRHEWVHVWQHSVENGVFVSWQEKKRFLVFSFCRVSW